MTSIMSRQLQAQSMGNIHHKHYITIMYFVVHRYKFHSLTQMPRVGFLNVVSASSRQSFLERSCECHLSSPVGITVNSPPIQTLPQRLGRVRFCSSTPQICNIISIHNRVRRPLLPPEGAALGQSGLASGRLAEHLRAACADYDGLCVGEDGGDGEAAWTLDVHEEGARSWDKSLTTC